MEPTPTPMANTDSSSVSTVPSDRSVSRATTGNSVISVAPMVQNQDRPRTREPDRADRRGMAHHAPGLGEQVRRDAQRWIGGRRGGDPDRREQPEQRECDAGGADPGGAVRQQHQGAAGDGAADDRQEGRRLDHAVAGDQFVLGEMLRQQAVFHRTEQRRLHAEAGQHDQQARHALGQERRGSRRHQEQLGQLCRPG